MSMVTRSKGKKNSTQDSPSFIKFGRVLDTFLDQKCENIPDDQKKRIKTDLNGLFESKVFFSDQNVFPVKTIGIDFNPRPGDSPNDYAVIFKAWLRETYTEMVVDTKENDFDRASVIVSAGGRDIAAPDTTGGASSTPDAIGGSSGTMAPNATGVASSVVVPNATGGDSSVVVPNATGGASSVVVPNATEGTSSSGMAALNATEGTSVMTAAVSGKSTGSLVSAACTSGTVINVADIISRLAMLEMQNAALKQKEEKHEAIIKEKEEQIRIKEEANAELVKSMRHLALQHTEPEKTDHKESAADENTGKVLLEKVNAVLNLLKKESAIENAEEGPIISGNTGDVVPDKEDPKNTTKEPNGGVLPKETGPASQGNVRIDNPGKNDKRPADQTENDSRKRRKMDQSEVPDDKDLKNKKTATRNDNPGFLFLAPKDFTSVAKTCLSTVKAGSEAMLGAFGIQKPKNADPKNDKP